MCIRDREKPALDEIRRVVTIFRELRQGATGDGKTKLKSPSGTLSTAEAISVVNNGLAMAGYFGDCQILSLIHISRRTFTYKPSVQGTG